MLAFSYARLSYSNAKANAKAVAGCARPMCNPTAVARPNTLRGVNADIRYQRFTCISSQLQDPS